MNRFIITALLLLPLLTACKSEEGYPVGKDIPNPSELSELPRVYVTTPDNIAVTSKTDWISGSTLSIFDHQGNELLTTQTSIRGRGNTTWGYPKKPYALKLDTKSEILGMPKHKRWVLLANWLDRTLLRNDIALEMGRRTMEWAPRGEFVELFLNGKFLGNYYLCEQIKVDKNRVNVDKIDEDTDLTDKAQISGGYILEFDIYGPDDEINYFYTSVKKYPVTIKEPDEEIITSWDSPAYTYIKEYVNQIEFTFESDKNDLRKWDEIASLIDVKSYIDWWIIHELACNREATHPKSCYMYKKRDGKLYAGPLWDFDWGTFVTNYNKLILVKSLWYGYLFEYTEFKNEVKSRWAELKDMYATIDQYIESRAEFTKESCEVDFSKWPISGNVNGDENLTYAKAIKNMRSAYNNRYNIVNNYIHAL